MTKKAQFALDLIVEVKSLRADIKTHQANLHALALRNTDFIHQEYFNNAILSLALLDDIVKLKEQRMLGLPRG